MLKILNDIVKLIGKWTSALLNDIPANGRLAEWVRISNCMFEFSTLLHYEKLFLKTSIWSNQRSKDNDLLSTKKHLLHKCRAKKQRHSWFFKLFLSPGQSMSWSMLVLCCKIGVSPTVVCPTCPRSWHSVWEGVCLCVRVQTDCQDSVKECRHPGSLCVHEQS